jgi:biotin carboxyl carrier protein
MKDGGTRAVPTGSARQARSSRGSPGGDVFRAEALQARFDVASAINGVGRPLTALSVWSVGPLLIASGLPIVAVVFACTAEMSEWTRGPAVIRQVGTMKIVAPHEGVVRALFVERDDAVSPGAPLVFVDSGVGTVELGARRRAVASALIAVLRNPADQDAARRAAAASDELNIAWARYRTEPVRAPSAGIVSDVWVREGDSVQRGEPLIVLRGGDAEFEVIAAVPGYLRPHLRPQASVRLVLDGFPRSPIQTAVGVVADEVLAPSELRRRYPQLPEASELGRGGTVLVGMIDLKSTSHGESGPPIHPGMVGRADVLLRRSRLAEIVFPELFGGRLKRTTTNVPSTTARH